MKAEITGENLSILKCELDKEDTILADAGVTLWKNEGINQKTDFNGGLFKGIGRALTGETMFINTYTCNEEKAEIVFSPEDSKKIIEFNLNQDETILCQKGSFLCADKDIRTFTVSTNKMGDNLFMQRIKGPGKVFLAIGCNVVEKELQEEETLEIGNATIVAMSSDAKLIKKGNNGFKNAVFGGMGFSNTVVKGPGKIWIEQYRM